MKTHKQKTVNTSKKEWTPDGRGGVRGDKGVGCRRPTEGCARCGEEGRSNRGGKEMGSGCGEGKGSKGGGGFSRKYRSSTKERSHKSANYSFPTNDTGGVLLFRSIFAGSFAKVYFG